MSQTTWLLPEGIEECLPEEASKLEALRHKLIKIFESFGYQLVIPPIIEYLESLLADLGPDLDKQTFKLIDPLSGKLLGIRADMTPQVARIDAHRLQNNIPSRLFYIGHVLHTQAQGFDLTRSPIQIGAELYGHAGFESDVEIILLMLNVLSAAGLNDIVLDLGHVAIYRSLVQQIDLSQEQELQLFKLLQNKSKPELKTFLYDKTLNIPTHISDLLFNLVDWHGDISILQSARQAFISINQDIVSMIDYLEKISLFLQSQFPNVLIHYDLAELHGYDYKTGLVFAAYLSSQGQEIARGGRYDGIGAHFGRTRAATGFSCDLQRLERMGKQYNIPPKEKIWAPWQEDTHLFEKILLLREQGYCVIQEMPGQEGSALEHGCQKRLVRQGDQWEVEIIHG